MCCFMYSVSKSFDLYDFKYYFKQDPYLVYFAEKLALLKFL